MAKFNKNDLSIKQKFLLRLIFDLEKKIQNLILEFEKENIKTIEL